MRVPINLWLCCFGLFLFSLPVIASEDEQTSPAPPANSVKKDKNSPKTTSSTSQKPPVAKPPAVPTPAEPEVGEPFDADAAQLRIVISRTAQLFHIVDQLSGWNENTHKQYRTHFEASTEGLSREDEAYLEKHRTLRQKYGYNSGLDMTFYSPLDLDAAAAKGVEKHWLTTEEAKTEREILNHFAPRIDPLIQQGQPQFTKLQGRMNAEQERIKAFSTQVSQFCGGKKIKVPVYFIVSPHSVNHLATFDGTRITLEVPRLYDPYITLMREVWRVFLQPYKGDIEQAVQGVSGLDFTTLNQGIAYALTPGLHRATEGDDILLLRSARDLETSKSIEEPIVRYYRFALMLRPALSAALADKNQTITTFLPQAVAVWRAMNELQRAEAKTGVSAYKVNRIPTLFLFGEQDGFLTTVFKETPYNVINGLHDGDIYRDLLGQHSKPDDVVVLLLTTDTLSLFPMRYSDFLPMPMSEIQWRLSQGETVLREHTVRQMRVILLAAPKPVTLAMLARNNRTLWQ